MSIRKALEERIKSLEKVIVRKARLITLPFFDGEPVYDVAVFFWKGLYDGAISTRASAIAFNFILAIFPAIIFVFTLIPYIPIPDFQQQLLILLQSILPHDAFVAIRGTIEDIVTQPRGGLLSFGFLAAFLFATNGIVSVIAAFNGTIHAIETRTWINQRLVALILAVILTLLTAISVALITVSQAVMDFMVDHGFLQINHTFYYQLILGGRWLIICFLFFFGYAFLFYLAPARKTKFRFFSAGGTLATILTILTTIGFSYYINNFGKYNTLYGSIGTLVVVMLSVYFNALILLIGFELNVSIWHSRRSNSDSGVEDKL